MFNRSTLIHLENWGMFKICFNRQDLARRFGFLFRLYVAWLNGLKSINLFGTISLILFALKIGQWNILIIRSFFVSIMERIRKGFLKWRVEHRVVFIGLCLDIVTAKFWSTSIYQGARMKTYMNTVKCKNWKLLVGVLKPCNNLVIFSPKPIPPPWTIWNFLSKFCRMPGAWTWGEATFFKAASLRRCTLVAKMLVGRIAHICWGWPETIQLVPIYLSQKNPFKPKLSGEESSKVKHRWSHETPEVSSSFPRAVAKVRSGDLQHPSYLRWCWWVFYFRIVSG